MDQKYVAGKQLTNPVQRVERNGNAFYFFGKKECLEVRVISDRVLKFRMAPDGRFSDNFSYAIQEHPWSIQSLTDDQTEEDYRIITSEVICFINKSTMTMRIEDHAGFVFNEDETGIHWEDNVEFGGHYVYCSKVVEEGESFYGLGDKPTELNLFGKRLCNWGEDTYGYEKNRDPLYRNIPFYMGLRDGKGYGIFFDNSFKSYFDFGHENEEVLSFWANGGEMDYYYIHGPNLMEVVEQYSHLTGKHYLPPMWALGYHQCRWSYYPESVVRDLAATFREKNIPCDALYLDIDYMEGFRCFTWNKEYFPDPKTMLSDLKEDGFKTVVIIDPGIKIDDEYWVDQEGLENDYFCRRADGALMEGPVWPGKCHFPDFTNPAVREWWGTLFQGFVDLGVDGVWNDMNEPAVFGIGTFPDDVRHDYDGHPCSHRKAHNVYGMQMVRATYEGLEKLQKVKRPFTITRSGYAGLQRYASVWTGDNVATWEHLRLANLQCQRLAVSGISFAGSDIGGFTGSPDGELFARWIQLGVFSPLMRVHSAGDTPDQEPWSFGPEVEDLARQFIELRYQLLPYLYTTFWQNTVYGTPMIRPLVYLDQEDPGTLHREDEFGYGDNLLVCPVSDPGIEQRNVYLPRGKWYHYFSDECYDGGTEISVNTPMNEMPLFVKAGAVLPHFPVMQYVNEKPIDVLTLHVYFKDGEHTSTLYQDHGDNYAYQQGIYSIKTFSFSGSRASATVEQEKEGLFNSSYKHYLFVLHGLPFEPTEIIVDDKLNMEFSKGPKGTVQVLVRKYFNKLFIR